VKNKKFIEIEIQVQVETTKNLLAFLRNNAKFISKERQIDIYYNPAHRNFLSVKPINEWLRIRNSSGKYSINYKYWHYDKNGKSDYGDEYETEIQNIEAVKKIFAALDIKPSVTVDKTRRIWRYKNYEVAIDSVKNLGKFIEVEYKGELNGKTPAKINNGMVLFLKEQNCGKIIRNYGGYPYRILFPNEAKKEEY